MKPYPNYKDSRIEWLGEVPEQWKTDKLKYVGKVQFSNVDKHSIDGEEPVRLCNYVDVYKNEFIDLKLDFMEATATKQEISKFRLEIGDVLVTKDSETPDDIAVPALVRGVSDKLLCGYHLAQIKASNNQLLGDYLFRLFQTRGFNTRFESAARGITRYGLSTDAFTDAIIPLPYLSEQKSIVSYLNHKTSQIDSLIEKKQKLIELLKEYRNAVINQAVTKGLNPDVPMKDSGIEWLGEVPEHWEVKKLKYLARLKSGDTITSEEIKEQGDYPVYGGNGLRGYYSDFTNVGDYILIGRQGALCGNINYASGKFWASEHAVVVYPVKKTNLIWLGELLRIMNLKQYSQAAAQPGLAVERIRNLFIPVPSSIEQDMIYRFLQTETIKIDSLIEKQQKQISLLKEYRTALISDVVTGKIDVRGEI